LSSQLHLFEKQKTHIFYNLLKQMCACAWIELLSV
jgi:hypothetical protein